MVRTASTERGAIVKTSAKITGVEQTKAKFAELSKQLGDAVAMAVLASAESVKTTAVKSIQEQSPGRQVIRSRAGGSTYNHIAAQAGEAPNTDTGRLSSSIAVEIDASRLTALIGTNVDYSRVLELGSSTMEARPYLQPALERNREKTKNRIIRALKVQINSNRE